MDATSSRTCKQSTVRRSATTGRTGVLDEPCDLLLINKLKSTICTSGKVLTYSQTKHRESCQSLWSRMVTSGSTGDWFLNELWPGESCQSPWSESQLLNARCKICKRLLEQRSMCQHAALLHEGRAARAFLHCNIGSRGTLLQAWPQNTTDSPIKGSSSQSSNSQSACTGRSDRVSMASKGSQEAREAMKCLRGLRHTDSLTHDQF